MPAHPSRTTPAPRSHAAAAFTPDDVVAFRLRPLGNISTVSPFTSSAPSSTKYTTSMQASVSTSPSTPIRPPPLPSMSGAAAKAATSRSHVNAIVGNSSNSAVLKCTEGEKRSREGGMDEVVAIRVPCAAVPHVYAALIPAAVTSRSPIEDVALTNASARSVGGGDAEKNVASALQRTSKNSLNEDDPSFDEAARHFLVPSSVDIPAPNLRLSEAQELARWTHHTAAVRGMATAAAISTPKAVSKTNVSSTALPAVETEVLHHWWRERLTVRLKHRHTNAVFGELASVLENAVRSALTAEEAYWQQQRSETNARGIMSSTPANTFVPAGRMEPLMRAVQLILHQTTVAFVEAQMTLTATTSTPLLREHGDDTARESDDNNNSDEIVKETDDLSCGERAEVLQKILHAECELANETKMASSVLATPSVVTLPPESLIPPPILRLETAVGATVLSRIIEQAEASTPGMAFARHLLHHYILPHVYVDYAAWMAVRPQMGGLSEQVTHLATVPLRLQHQHDVVVAAAQAQADMRYLEAVVKSWTMRSWLRYVTKERQRVLQCVALERAFATLQGRLRLQRGFTQWQRRTQQHQQRRQQSRMEEDYNRFLSDSQATAGLDGALSVAFSKGTVDGHTWASLPALPHSPAAGFGGGGAAAERTLGRGPNGNRSLAFSSTSAPRHHASGSSKKKGAGHSRVYLSFMRPKMSTSSAADASDAEGYEGGVERFVVRNSDSDIDDDADEEYADAMEAGDEGDLSRPRPKRGDPASLRNRKINGATSLMYLEQPKPAEDDAFTTSTDVVNVPSAVAGRSNEEASMTAAQAPPKLFTTMMAKLKEMEEVNAYLRKELAVQSRRLRKVESDNKGLRQRNSELEEGTLRLVREKLEACNTAQQHSVTIMEKNRQIRQLRSRLRAHRHRPWQQTVMRLVGDVCAVSTAAAERADEVQVHYDRYGRSEIDKGLHPGGSANGGVALKSPNDLAHVNERDDRAKMQPQTTTASTVASPNANFLGESPSEEDRLFGQIAPIVLHSTKQLPEARVILADWANSCLDDLQRLDDLHGGALSLRFGSFSEEARSGVLISRLLYYLALPRYRAQTSAADTTVDVMNRGTMAEDEEDSETVNGNWTGMDPRRQLLEQHGVQLDPPYPVYEDCFNDILTLPPIDRMLQLLAFATELMTSQAGDPANLSREVQPSKELSAAMSTMSNTVSVKDKAATKSAGGTPNDKGKTDATDRATPSTGSTTATATHSALLPAVPIPLHSVVDPYALARGEASAVITLVALLYVRFAHPFHHKSQRCALQERRMLLQLWSNGDATAEELACPLERASREGNDSDKPDASLISLLPMDDATVSISKDENTVTKKADTDAHPDNNSLRRLPNANNKLAVDAPEPFSIEAEMLRQLAPEDKTPWQLFRERCLPVFGTQAHPFLLHGGFWPAEAFDTPELAAMLGALAMALHRSLELHRWHVTLSCLVPVRTYSGLSRGIFTGPDASPAALELGLRQDGQEWLCLDFPLVRQCVEARRRQFQAASAITTASGLAVSLSLREGIAPADVLSVASSPLLSSPVKQSPAQEEIATLLKDVTGVWQKDLLSLFTQRATLSPQLALPVLDLGSWRLLCGDLGLIDLANLEYENADGSGDVHQARKQLSLPDSSVKPKMQQRAVDMEIVTTIFQNAVMAVAQSRGEVDPAVFRNAPNRNGQQPQQREQSPQRQQPPRANVSMEYVLGDSALALRVSDANVEQSRIGGISSKPSRILHDSTDRTAVPDIQIDMTYAAFVLALALLADALYPGASTLPQERSPRSSTSLLHHDSHNTNEKKNATPKSEDVAAATVAKPSAHPNSSALQYCPLSMAFAEMMQCIVLTSPFVHLHPSDPRSILRRLTCGLPTQVVLHRHSPALLLVYQAYSKDIFGEEGLLREDVLRLLRDAMLTSSELSQYLVFDLFARCAVLRRANEEAAVSMRRDIDGRVRPGAVAAAARKPGYRAVRIVDPSTSTDNSAAAAAQRKRAFVLTFEGFCDLLCVLCNFKQPNVFVPFEERLNLFLRRSLLRPLTHTVPGLGLLLSQSQPVQETPSNERAPSPDKPAGAHASRAAR